MARPYNGPRIMTLGDLPKDESYDIRFDDEEKESRKRSNEQYQIGFVTVDGEMNEEIIRGRQNLPKMMCLAACCPCCIGGPCSENRKQEWFRLLKVPTFWLIVIQIIMFIIEISLDGFDPPKDNPNLGPPIESLVNTGGKYAYAMKEQYHIFRFFTPIFVHAGLIHLFFNCLAEFKLCIYLEKKWGELIYWTIYWVAGFASELLSAIANPGKISVGASGAILGVVGAYLIDLLLVHDHNKLSRRLNIAQMVIFIIVSLVLGFSPYVDFSAHLGGVATGCLLGIAVFIHKSKKVSNQIKKIVSVVMVVLLVLLLILGIVLFYAIVTTPKLL